MPQASFLQKEKKSIYRTLTVHQCSLLWVHRRVWGEPWYPHVLIIKWMSSGTCRFAESEPHFACLMPPQLLWRWILTARKPPGFVVSLLSDLWIFCVHVTFMYDVFPLLMLSSFCSQRCSCVPADSFVCGNERDKSNGFPPRMQLINYPLQPKHQAKQFFQAVTDEQCPKEFSFSDVH